MVVVERAVEETRGDDVRVDLLDNLVLVVVFEE